MSFAPFHHCSQCGFEAEVATTSLNEFVENPSCPRCGFSATEGDYKMQDELSSLFARQMNVANPAPIVYSITQHYHHSGHQAPVATERPAQEPEQAPALSPEDILTQHNIDPSSLFPSQLTLFKQAEDEQKRRLIELWQISPPSYSNQALAQELGTWPPTSMDREEEMARLRYERMQAAQNNTYSARDGGMQDNLSSQACGHDESHHAEPYVVSGYEMLAQREYEQRARDAEAASNKVMYSPFGSAVGKYVQAVDPVYQGREWWIHSSPQDQHIEFQYGAFQEMNSHGGNDHSMRDEEML